MFSHFNTQVFISALKANQNLVTFLSTTFALMLTLLLQGTIQGNLKPTYFLYAFLVCIAFAIWTSIDQKFRQSQNAEAR
ncbi:MULTISPECIES: hypothetical protein [Acinetobacter]|uniref:hypothetical protein n=1 Tax=Acinetobacter TaxID=469 RepID=UPI001444253D|nr:MULTISPECIES: hypothetical protein [Acinetobacter]MBF4520922.1 hypothetical protein [Acinetobacter towneri]MDM1486129.1 hypothetical protein [Acinetobacter towneri]MEB6565037.1 hypothetical protein [Acinetobacter towneri]